MFRLWAKKFHDNHLIEDLTVCDGGETKNRTRKVFDAVDEICYAFDLSKPIWLDANVEEFQRMAKTRFTQDNFIDGIDFDFLEIQVIEED